MIILTALLPFTILLLFLTLIYLCMKGAATVRTEKIDELTRKVESGLKSLEAQQ